MRRANCWGSTMEDSYVAGRAAVGHLFVGMMCFSAKKGDGKGVGKGEDKGEDKDCMSSRLLLPMGL